MTFLQFHNTKLPNQNGDQNGRKFKMAASKKGIQTKVVENKKPILKKRKTASINKIPFVK
jgi:hypothetical protein